MKKLIRQLINLPGPKTSRKIIVIESDDWGSIRMPSKQAYTELVKKKHIQGNNPFLMYDSLASESDLSRLFDLTSSISDINGSHPIITANTITSNPDFQKIKDSGYKEYFYESFTKTLQRYPEHQNSFKVWKEGIDLGLFYPQLHGREHINVGLWLNRLRGNSSPFLDAFNLQCYAIEDALSASLNYTSEIEKSFVVDSIKEAFANFQEIFGYKSHSFIAPNYTWNSTIEKKLANEGVKLIQGSKKQNIPTGNGKLSQRYHYCGQRNSFNQYYLVRNCLFEPSVSPKTDYVDLCMQQINNAFRWKKPAIISSHRLNYIGYLDKKNRDHGLSQLKKLLISIQKNWPEVEFARNTDLLKIFERK